MPTRRLAAFALPLARGPWASLRFDGEGWTLLDRRPPQGEQRLDRVEVALEGPGWRWLRLRWQGPGWRRWWPHEVHVWLRQRDHPHAWPLIGAALAQHRGRPWLGR